MLAPFLFGANVKRIIIGLALAASSAIAAPVIKIVEPTVSIQVKRRKINTTANKINVFYGYPSDRKGKGQRAREASARRKKGW